MWTMACLGYAFDDTPCESTSCGVKWETNTGDCDVSLTGNIMVNWKIRLAVAAWLSDATAAGRRTAMFLPGRPAGSPARPIYFVGAPPLITQDLLLRHSSEAL